MRIDPLRRTASLTETKIGKDLGVVVYYPLLVVKVNDEIGGLRRP
jgi:hypothetical protein